TDGHPCLWQAHLTCGRYIARANGASQLQFAGADIRGPVAPSSRHAIVSVVSEAAAHGPLKPPGSPAARSKGRSQYLFYDVNSASGWLDQPRDSSLNAA